MAGSRKGTGKPLRRVARAERRAAWFLPRLGAQATWVARLGPSFDHVRGGLHRLARTNPAAAEAAAEPLVRLLMQTATELDRLTARDPRRSA